VPKWLEVDQKNLRMRFSALNADFSNRSPDPLGSRRPAHTSVKRGTPLKSGYLSTAGLSSVTMIAHRHRHAA